MLDGFHLQQEIKTEAQRLGFTHIGIAPAHPVPHYKAFAEWVSAGHQADMAYLSRPDTLAKRADPGLILPGCQRVISLAMPYHPPMSPLDPVPPGCGRISAYARTQDYHEVIWDKLSQLEAHILTHTGGKARVKSYVDTGPILERAFAAEAGIGAQGKNSCLIVPGAGSYVFLAEVLTDWELPVDEPFTRDLCGSCRRCIEACPTNCIQPGRTIDARRCISALTIENKASIPDPLKKYLGNWFFGCDICQMVCPHNTRSPQGSVALGPPLLPEFIDLLPLLAWDEDAVRKAFAGTALMRSKRVGLIRNAAIALGNQRCSDARPYLEDLLDRDPDPVIQEACRWAIQHIEGIEG